MTPLDWEKMTPKNLRPAIKHIRDTFRSSQWKCSRITEVLCYAALHPKEPVPQDFDQYLEAFRTYRVILGHSASREFDRVIASGTAPSIFKAYQDAFRQGIESELERLFEDVLQIGLANATALDTHPVDWAKAQLSLMLEGKYQSFLSWIKSVCDKQDLSDTPTSDQEWEDFMYWKNWRAPKLIYMVPSGNLAYQATSAWDREDQASTEKLLKGLTDRFVQFAGFHLDEAAGNAQVRLAKNRSSLGPTTSDRASERKRNEELLHNGKGQTLPKVFISYSWDSSEHRKWVIDLATRLRTESGIDVVLDHWNLTPGRDKTIFMETSVSESDFVILICTPKYAERANKRHGGVGYESMIITGELARKIAQDKFIPVLREGNWEESVPIWIQTKKGVDLSGAVYSETEYESLVCAVHRESLAPPVGRKPTFGASVNETELEHWDDMARLAKGMSMEGANPLSAVRNGDVVDISVSAFGARFHDRKSAVYYNSGSISFSGPPHRYYVFARDPQKHGGAVAYQFTDKRGEALIGDDIIYIGSVRI